MDESLKPPKHSKEELVVTNITNQNYTPDPIYTISGKQEYSLSPIEILAARENKLDRWEMDLEFRENEIKHQSHMQKENNWPPIPRWCHRNLKPCFYQDIEEEIENSFQKLIRKLYYLWIAHTALLLINMMVGVLYMFVGGDNGETFGLSLVYMGIFTPLSFVCWFRPAYKGFRDNSSLNFMLFFFVFSAQFLVSIIYALGIGTMGSCGLILGVSAISHGDSNGKIFVGICMIILGICFGITAIGDLHLLKTIHNVYRSTGASVANAKSEFATGMMKNSDIQMAVSNVVKETAKHSSDSTTKETYNNRTTRN